MQVWQRAEIPEAVRGAAAAIGNFDGIHRGHQALIARTAEAARRLGAPLAAVTFEPHPRRFFRPSEPPFRLTTARERARRLAALGVEHVFELPFDAALARMGPEAFVTEILSERLGLRHLAAGQDFRFGKGRAGDGALLARICPGLGIGLDLLDLVSDEEGVVSSSAIRTHLRAGDCVGAARLLGRWPGLTGPVVRGDQRGRTLGYPTANLDPGEQLLPRYGVYAAEVTVLEGPHAGRYPGVASLGERPQFGVNTPNFEVHLFDFVGDLYGAEIDCALLAFLRPEARFASVDALIAQMDRDSADARAILATAQLPE